MTRLPTKPYIGGQAVLEGVMMRGTQGVSVAVRRPDGSIVLRRTPLRTRFKSRLWRIPALRGIAMLIDSVTLGYEALHFSAAEQLTDEADREQHKNSGKMALLLSAVVAIGLFVALPQGLAALTATIGGFHLEVQDTRFHLLIGAFKLLVVVGYLLLLSRIPEVRRVFEYHGAEHKTIFAYEAGEPLTVDSVRKKPRLHPRCGTTFLVTVVAISIVMSATLTPLVVGAHGVLGQAMTFGVRLLLLPLAAAVSYELQRWSARYCTRGVLRVLLWPGFSFQTITVREPDDAELEVAIAAMEGARDYDAQVAPLPSEPDLRVFESFTAFRREFLAARAPVDGQAA